MADTYKIVQQRQTSRLSPGGGFEDVMEITFTVQPSNVTAQESVPLTLYTKEFVETTLTNRAEQINDIAGL